MLRELQSRMARSLLEDFRAPPPDGLVAGDAARAAARFMIHRGNVIESLAGALGHSYPAVKAIAGEGNFRVLAAAYVRAHPPLKPQLLAYGADFPAFVAGHGAAMRDHPFLADLARLEWAMNEAYDAVEAPALAPETLAAISPERLPALRLALHPAARIVASEHPIHAIWTAATAGGTAPDPAPDDGTPFGDAVLVARPSGPVEAFRLGAGETAFLGAVAAGAPLENALAEAEAAEAGFDFAAALAACLSRGVFGAEVSFDPTLNGGVA
jgi:hypothetical protein